MLKIKDAEGCTFNAVANVSWVNNSL
jgi:hypothetical protein